MLSVIILAFSLALDAVSVSVVEGALYKKKSFILALKLAFTFGIFQTGLALLGYLFGALFNVWFESVHYWVAFVLLSIIGLHMIFASFKEIEEMERRVLSLTVLLLLALATSIDAGVAGITLGAFNVEVWLSILVIGLVTFVLCCIGTILGQYLFPYLKQIKIEAFGGIVLIVIGVKTLLENF